MTLRTAPLIAITVALGTLASCAPLSNEADSEDAKHSDEALAGSVASIAQSNVGRTACGPNSLGGTGFESSCNGNGGQPEYWCSDFAKWVWQKAGAKVDGLSAAAGSFYCYGQNHGTLSNTPHVGDAVVFDYQGNCWADHVAIVTQVNPNGSIVTVSGDWNGQSGSEAHFSSTSSVVTNQPAYNSAVGTTPGVIGMTISGFISPTGIPAAVPTPPPPSPEGSQAYLYPNQQHFLSRDGAGNIRHHWWDASSQSITTDTWGTGAAGQPVAFVDGTSQHVFARGGDGSLQHWFWDPINGPNHDVWAPNGLSGDPAAVMIGDYQDVWAVDQASSLQHWYWGPSSNGVQHDTWGSGAVGRPSVLVTTSGEQHAFARGTGGNLEHWWWAPNGGGIQHDTWGNGLAGDPSALAIDGFQDVWAVDGGGNLQHWYWGPTTNGVQHDTWGSGVVGRPSVFVTPNGEQHTFARGTDGSLQHWFWAANTGISHDTWGTGIVSDPTAQTINNQQHVWAQDAAGHAEHWYWDPTANAIQHDDWGP